MKIFLQRFFFSEKVCAKTETISERWSFLMAVISREPIQECEDFTSHYMGNQ